MNKRISQVNVYTAAENDGLTYTYVEFNREDNKYRLRDVNTEEKADRLNRILGSTLVVFEKIHVHPEGIVTARFKRVRDEESEQFEIARRLANWDISDDDDVQFDPLEDITNIRADLESEGYDVSKLSYDVLMNIAIKAQVSDVSYWDKLESLAEMYGIPKFGE